MKDFKLDQIPKINSGFKVPDGYFDDFDAKIIRQLPQNEAKIISIFRKSTFWIAAAAVFIIGFSAVYFSQTNEALSVSNEDYLVLEENLNAEDFAEHLTENDILELENTLTTYDLEFKKLTNENF